MAAMRAMHDLGELRPASLTSEQADGVKVLVIMSTLSLTAVISLLLVVLISALRAAYYRSGSNISRSHVTAYLVSLLVSDLFQGSIMNTKWVQSMAVNLDGFCTAQGAFKQVADVGIAFWISTIAVHTFNVLVLGIHIRRIFMYTVLVGGWTFIAGIVAMGPFILQEPSRGPYFGISGYWCWISKTYEIEQIVLDYMMMFLSAMTSFVLYVLVFLKLRGNLLVLPGGRVRLRFVQQEDAWVLHQRSEGSDLQAHITSVAKHMLLYPIAYLVLIVPIAACRIAGWAGHEAPLGVVIFSDSVFLLSGFVNTSLFVLTGRVVPLREIRNVFRAPFSKPTGRSDLQISVAGGFNSETHMKRSSSSASTDNSGCGLEKDLPELPQVSYSAISHTPHSASVGRKDSYSETCRLV